MQTELSPFIQSLKDKYVERMAYKRRVGLIQDTRVVQPDLQHAPLEVTWTYDGAATAFPTPRYFVVYYCPDCLEGRIGGTTFDQPEGPGARELGIIKKAEWDQKCSAKTSDL